MSSSQTRGPFFEGPPPHIGWWYTLNDLGKTGWRWFDGEHYSPPVLEQELPSYVALMALHKADTIGEVKWSAYYPENARVPRVKPGEYTEMQSGQVLRVSTAAPFYQRCCDCGLVHEFTYKAYIDNELVEGAHIDISARRL